jgi:hypothetical protein
VTLRSRGSSWGIAPSTPPANFYVDGSTQRRAFKVYQELNRRDRAETNAVPKLDFDFGCRKRRGPK